MSTLQATSTFEQLHAESIAQEAAVYEHVEQYWDRHADETSWDDPEFEGTWAPTAADERWLAEQHAESEEDARWRDYEEWSARIEADQIEPISDADHLIATGCV